ncbi:MAG TPA: histidinol-phosphate transaminase [Usitatibacter sp.]|nr:histidinol-phosphate transaminase [Usitatibacter sp.]
MKTPADLVRREVLALKAYHVPPAQGFVKLDAMENPYPLPPELAREMGERLARVAVNRYPDPTAPRLHEAVREAMRIPDSLDVMLGNGSDELLQIISVALSRKRAVALALEPSFVMYRATAIAAGLRFESVPLRDDFTLDEDALQRAIHEHEPALTWIAYPNNPTGNLFPREAIVRAIDASPGLVVVDEAYYPFSGGASLLGEVGEHPNFVMVRTVSKLGLAGLRLGVCIGPPAWMRELEKLRMPYNVNVLTAAAAELLLGHRDVLDAQTASIVQERSRLEAALDRMPEVERFPSAANFVLIRVADAPAAFEGLRQRGILIKTLHGSHPLLANCLRLTVGTPDENAKLIEALASALSHA